MAGLLDEEKYIRGNLLPFKKDIKTKEVSFGMPTVAQGLLDAITAPMRAYRGEINPDSPQGVQEAMNVGLNLMGGGFAAPTAGMAGGKTLAMNPPIKFLGKPLEGMPKLIDVGGGKLEQFGTDQRIVDIASQYAADRGLPYKTQTQYASVDPIRAKRIAQAYQVMKDNPADKNVKAAYDALVNETQAQYEALRKAGYKFEFMPEGKDVYGNPRNAINDIVTNKHMFVFPTASGFGTENVASAANPLLMRTGEKWGGQDVMANDLFRAVHDVFGHSKHGVGFRAGGEENAYQSHAKMYSPQALPAATSETRGQNSWLNFGKYGDRNRTANTENTIFADQKTGLMPDWTWQEGILR